MPLVLVWAGARPARLVRWTTAYPEPFAVLLVVVTVVMGAVVPSGLLGIGVAAVLASVILVLTGWAFAVAALGPRGVPAVLLAAVLWPGALLLERVLRANPVETYLQVGAAAMLGVGCILALLLLRHRPTSPVQVSTPARQEMVVG